MRNACIVALACALLSSCASFTPASRSVVSVFLDYRPYMSEGFFISPDPYPGSCEILGELALEVRPGQMEIDEVSVAFFDSVTYRNNKYYGYERISYETLLDTAVSKAKATGADGLVNFSIQKVDGLHPYYIVTGVCIKR